MSNKYNIFFLIALMVVLISFPVLADFDAIQTTASYSICPRDTQLFVDKVKNLGTSEAEFTVNLVGSASVWATSIPTGFILKPNEERVIYTYVTPMSTTAPGIYDLEIKITSQGILKTIQHQVNVKDCHVLSSSFVSATPPTICPEGTVKYEFLVKNEGSYQESYSLSTEGQAKNWVTLSEQKILLNSGQTKTINAYLKALGDAIGEYDFNFISKSDTSNAISSTQAKVIVQPCFNFSVSVEKNYFDFCEHTKQIIPIEIINYGTVPNIYKLSVDGPAWASLEKTSLEVNTGARGAVNLILAPDFNIQGDSDIKITIVPDKGSLQAIDEIKAHVRKCHSVMLDILAEKDKICASAQNNYNVIVKNNGEVPKDYRIELDAPTWIKLDITQNTTFFLNAGESKTFNLNVNPPSSIETGKYNIKVKVSATDESKVAAEDPMIIETVSKEECYMPKLTLAEKDISVYYDSTATIPITIENRGLYKANYEIGVSDTASSFVKLTPSTAVIEPETSAIVYAYIAPSAQISPGFYKATISVKLPDTTILTADTIDIEVSSTAGIPTKITGGAVREVEKISLWNKLINYIKDLFAVKPKLIENVTITNITVPGIEVPKIPEAENVTEVPKQVPEVNVTGQCIQGYKCISPTALMYQYEDCTWKNKSYTDCPGYAPVCSEGYCVSSSAITENVTKNTTEQPKQENETKVTSAAEQIIKNLTTLKTTVATNVTQQSIARRTIRFVWNYRNYILLGIITILVIMLLYKVIPFKKFKKKKPKIEEVEEEF